MGLWDVITGRSRPKQANLDALFAIPTAAITLETTLGLRPTGEGSVCYRAAAGAAFQQTQDEVVALLDADPDAPPVEVTRDEFGFTWLLNRHDPADIEGLCTDLHAVNTALESQGFGPGLLCSLVPFAMTRVDGSAWSTSTSRPRSTRSRRSPAPAAPATTCSRSRCATR